MTNLPYEAKTFSQKNQVCWINLESDMGSFWRKYKENEIGFPEWTLSIFKARSYAIFSLKDFKPFVIHGIGLIKKIIDKFLSSKVTC